MHPTGLGRGNEFMDEQEEIIRVQCLICGSTWKQLASERVRLTGAFKNKRDCEVCQMRKAIEDDRRRR